MRMRSALFPVLAAVLLLGVQCSSSTSDDSPGPGAGQGGAGGTAHGGSAGKAGAGGKGSAGTFGEAGAMSLGGAAGEGDSFAGEGGQSPLPAAGSGSGGKGGSGGNAGSGGKAGSAGTGGTGGTAGTGGFGGTGGKAGMGGNAGTGGNGGTGGGPSAPPPIAHFGQIRFVNLAPSSVPLDLCVKKTASANYPVTPILQGLGVGAGVPYGSESAYVDVAISAPPDTYDFVMVAGSAYNCDPPWYGAFGSLTFNPASSTTIAIFQSYFTGSGNYSAAVFSDGQGQTALTGNVRLFYAANGLSSAVDFHALRAGATDQTWYSNFMPGFGSSFRSAQVGSYDFRAMKAGTQTVVADKPGTAVAADDPFDLFLYQSEAAKQVLLGCSSRPESAVAACAR